MYEEDRLRQFHEGHKGILECCLTTALKIAMIELPTLINATNPQRRPRINMQHLQIAVPSKGNRSTRKNAQYHAFRQASVAAMNDENKVKYAPLRVSPTIDMTHPLVTWAQMAAYVSLGELVVLADSMMRRNAVKYRYTVQDFKDLLDALPQRFPHRASCLLALQYMRERTDSSMETRMRLALGNTKVPELMTLAINHPATIDNGKTVYLDMAIPDLHIGIEYSGRHHAEQWEDDEARRTALTAANWKAFTANAETLGNAAKWNTFVTQLRLAILEQHRGNLDNDNPRL